MAVTQQLKQKQAQTFTLTPQLHQAIQLLTLSNQELEAFLSEAMLENPLLSLDENHNDPESQDVYRSYC